MVKGDIICLYTGMSLEDVLFVNNRSEYILEVVWFNGVANELWYLDAAHLNATAGRYVNGIRGTGKNANAAHTCPLEYHETIGCWYISVVALDTIEVGEEVLVEYGDKYWNQIIPVNNFLRDEQIMDKIINTMS